MPSPVDRYLALRDEMDTLSARLMAMHGRHIACSRRCCDCCVNLTVSPVEFEAIRRGLVQAGVTTLDFALDASCGFLANGLCAIYPHRPIICRTHGLPIVFADEDGDERVWRVSFCEKNFTDAGDQDPAFGPDNTLNIDELNDQLRRINLDFITEAGDSPLTPTTRIELGRLVEVL